MYQSFEDLRVWQKACALAIDTYEALKSCGDRSLRDQMQRSAVSIASNIAEGSEHGPREVNRFLRIAKGSAAELRTQVHIASRVGVLSDRQQQLLAAKLKDVSRMLHGLAQAQSRRLNTEHGTRNTRESCAEYEGAASSGFDN